MKRTWIKNTLSIELSVYHAETTTNNGTESYHKLKTYIKTPHPRIWSFIATLNNIIVDYDTDLQRLQNGIEITRVRCRKDRDKVQVRTFARERLISGEITPLQFLCAVRETLDEHDPGNIIESDSESETEDDNLITTSIPICSVCLQPRSVTIMFLPCQHCNVCQNCSDVIAQVDQRCPVCRSNIDQRLVAYQ